MLGTRESGTSDVMPCSSYTQSRMTDLVLPTLPCPASKGRIGDGEGEGRRSKTRRKRGATAFEWTVVVRPRQPSNEFQPHCCVLQLQRLHCTMTGTAPSISPAPTAHHSQYRLWINGSRFQQGSCRFPIRLRSVSFRSVLPWLARSKPDCVFGCER